jgi:hypothetical protein
MVIGQATLDVLRRGDIENRCSDVGNRVNGDVAVRAAEADGGRI